MKDSAPTITVTDQALGQIRSILEEEGLKDQSLRVEARKVGPFRFEYDLYFVEEKEVTEADRRTELGELTLVVDSDSTPHLEGATIDYVVGPAGGFKFENPQSKRHFDDPKAEEIQDFLDQEVNPGVASHGGYIALHGFEHGTAYLEMGGGCQGCGMAAMTLRQGVEAKVRERFPEVSQIVDVTDHAGGTNPYYRPPDSTAGAS
ncbi:MAG: NifU family protein [Polyangiales bacterium]